MITGLDHIQLAHPAGAEDRMRGFYCDLLGMSEIAKPAPLQGRGGFWAMAGPLQIHFGVDPGFIPARKAHPTFVIDDLDALATRLDAAGYHVTWDESLPGVRRFFTVDPVGNRIECMEEHAREA
ncbi:VOC family protein [Loktanella agnita]|uniref:VOC family protein n=1 Tax=Loktanella agnita TaxID=287097 RepID=UPI00398710DA